MTKTNINRLSWLVLSVTIGAGIGACSDEASTASSDEVQAVDRVDDAATLARQNAPEADDLEFAESEAAADADADTVTDVDTDTDAEVAADTPADDGDEVEAVVAQADTAANNDLAVNAGEELYNTQCVACHQAGLLNAPKFGDAAAWAPRIEKGLDTLTMHSAEGFNQMPAQAVNGVTEEQVHAAVEYMVDAAS